MGEYAYIMQVYLYNSINQPTPNALKKDMLSLCRICNILQNNLFGEQ